MLEEERERKGVACRKEEKRGGWREGGRGRGGKREKRGGEGHEKQHKELTEQETAEQQASYDRFDVV